MMRWRLILIALSVVAFIAPSKAQNFYAGRGTGLDLNVLTLLGVRVADTGWLPPAGGHLAVSVGAGSLTSGPTTVVSTGIMISETTGAAGVVNSYSQVDGLRLFPGLTPALDLVRATVVRSDATANLTSYGGSSTITNLMVLGSSVTVTGAVNQTYSVPGILDLTINRQTVTGGVLRVDALYVEVLDPLRAGKVAVATSYAGIIPEPSSLCLAGLALPGIAAAFLRRRRI